MSGLKGIRGAVQAAEDSAAAIDAAARELLTAIVDRNRLDPASVIAMWFTQTPDLTAAHAAASARALGWDRVPLLGAQEAPVAGQMPRVIRSLVLAAGDGEPHHCYLGAARALREDLP